MISLSLQPSPASETSAFNKISAFVSRLAGIFPLVLSASSRSRSSALSRTTYLFTATSRAAILASVPKRSFPLSTFATHCSSLMRSSWMGVLLGTDAQEVGGFFLDVCRPCGDCEGEGGRDGVFGDGGEVVKQGVEAVDGETIVGSAGGLLGEGGGRSLSLCDRALAERLGGLLVGVVVEHGGQALAHVPFEIIGEHAEEDVGTHAVFEPVVDRPDMEVDGLDRPDGVLDQTQGFVAFDGFAVVERGFGQAGAHGVEAVEGGLLGDLGGLAGE